MRLRHFSVLLFLIYHVSVRAQPSTDAHYSQSIDAHRQHYKMEFLTEPRSPLSVSDSAFFDFYAPNPAWNIAARVELTPEAPVFDMMTYSGVTRKYRQYAVLSFEAAGQAQTLRLYQNLTLIEKDSSYKDYLFLPFKDLTNGEATYGGGRYLDFRLKDIQNGKLMIDFNKNYNPYCAYSDGYNCPIPPLQNHLNIEVPAGEKNFRKEKKHEKH